MTLTMRTEVLDLPFRDPFRIARTEDPEAAHSVLVELDLEGSAGQGECSPVPYYGETLETVAAVLPRLCSVSERLGPLPGDRAAMLTWLERSTVVMSDALGHHGGAKAGLDVAFHDMAGKSLGLPVWQLLGTSDQIPPTDYSLGLDEPAVVAERARRVAHFPALKIKVGGPADIETLEAVRAVFSGPLRVDANTGWQPDQAVAIIPELERLGVELVEQPFPARRLSQLRWLRERSSLPILADESAVFEDDLELLEGAVDGVVVKLAKCGGIGPALRMIRRAHELGLLVMLGCMVESSLGVAAAAAVASEVDWLDLDGNLLLASDPFGGLELDDACRWLLPSEPGLGVHRNPAT
ncbi:MAG TPA: dipeptide epimerase [Candidatus Limnocylindrales bacterium]|nr:dipeptide epimerase [Candidatus Limnocylindrales bacterium]